MDRRDLLKLAATYLFRTAPLFITIKVDDKRELAELYSRDKSLYRVFQDLYFNFIDPAWRDKDYLEYKSALKETFLVYDVKNGSWDAFSYAASNCGRSLVWDAPVGYLENKKLRYIEVA